MKVLNKIFVALLVIASISIIGLTVYTVWENQRPELVTTRIYEGEHHEVMVRAVYSDGSYTDKCLGYAH